MIIRPQKQKLNKKAMAALAKRNAEELMNHLCGKGFERAYNPHCPPKRRGRPAHGLSALAGLIKASPPCAL
jgi:hypothetical protein